jgi:hypothetical protein
VERDVSKNPGLLKLELYCKGMKIDETCNIAEDGAPISRTRGGLGSGLEVTLPDNLYTNIPVVEHFVKDSPYLLKKENDEYKIYKDDSYVATVKLLQNPKFYNKKTSSGRLMKRIGVMQGTYIGVYPTNVCGFWEMDKNCKFCSIGLNLGETEEIEKNVQDVLETVRAAREELGITFVHFNTGYYEGEAIDALLPYIHAVKKETGLLVGVQTPPQPDLKQYDYLKKIGVDHVSFCLEIYDKEIFPEICPGKSELLGWDMYIDTIEYCARLWGRGQVAGEIIAGLESPESSIKAIEHFARMGAVSTVCVFRPTIGTKLEDRSPPEVEDMIPVFRRMYEVCLENNLPVGIAPKAKVSLVLLPYEGIYFLEDWKKHWHKIAMMNTLKVLYRSYFYTRLFLQRK